MAAFLPFEPNMGATTGNTIAVVSGSSGASIASSVDCTSKPAPTILVTNQGPNTAFVRMSSEATPAATVADVPLLGNTVRLFANPVPFAKLGVAVTVSVTTSPNTVFFTPGNDGI